MAASYRGPVRREPLAVELHNTLYAAAGEALDGLRTEASSLAWLSALQPRLLVDHVPGSWPSRLELVELREPLRVALAAAVAGDRPGPAVVVALNRASARAPSAPAAVSTTGTVLKSVASFPDGVVRADVVVAALAADAIALLTGPRRAELRACGAPGCVLLYLKDHPRRAWCSNACGNRARQARHYQRTRQA